MRSRIMVQASAVRPRRFGIENNFRASTRESPASHCSDSSQNVSNLRSGVIESLRAVHDKIGAAALFDIRHICDKSLDASANDKPFRVPMLAWPQSVYCRHNFLAVRLIGALLCGLAAAKAIEGEFCFEIRSWGTEQSASSWVKLPVLAFKFPVLSIKIPCSVQ
jgi:hypothetical protein